MEEKSRAVVHIYGDEYIMRGETTPEYMAMLASYIDKKMRHIASRQPQLPMAKIAVLAALNVADELCKLQEDYDALVKLMDHDKTERKNKREDKRFEKKQA